MLKLISREKLEHIAKKHLNYPLHDAEKDYFLTRVMQIIAGSELAEILVFKGGTAIHHCYLEQIRFSEDLDFTSKNKKITLADIEELFKGNDSFEMRKKFESKATLKIGQFKYFGILETPNSIKLEVDRFQNVVLPAGTREYRNVWGLDFKVNVMSSIEICAEKIRACNDRFRYRDFYDLYNMVNSLKIDINQSIALLPQKEIRKPLAKENILRNLKLALNEIDQDGDTIVYEKEIKTKDLIDFFNQLTIPSYSANTQYESF